MYTDAEVTMNVTKDAIADEIKKPKLKMNKKMKNDEVEPERLVNYETLDKLDNKEYPENHAEAEENADMKTEAPKSRPAQRVYMSIPNICNAVADFQVGLKSKLDPTEPLAKLKSMMNIVRKLACVDSINADKKVRLLAQATIEDAKNPDDIDWKDSLVCDASNTMTWALLQTYMEECELSMRQPSMMKKSIYEKKVRPKSEASGSGRARQTKALERAVCDFEDAMKNNNQGLIEKALRTIANIDRFTIAEKMMKLVPENIAEQIKECRDDIVFVDEPIMSESELTWDDIMKRLTELVEVQKQVYTDVHTAASDHLAEVFAVSKQSAEVLEPLEATTKRKRNLECDA